MRRWIFACLLLFSPQTIAEIHKYEFDQTLETFEVLYTPRVQSDLGLTLRLESFWNRYSIITSSQARRVGKEAIIFIDGDLAKERLANRAAFVLLVCHEFGHIYGDAKGESKLNKEGKADYWAPSCAREFLTGIGSPRSDIVPEFLEQRCRENVKESYESCMQVASGITAYALTQGINMADGIDLTQNDRASNASFHPVPLCRIKTFIAGLFSDERP